MASESSLTTQERAGPTTTMWTEGRGGWFPRGNSKNCWQEQEAGCWAGKKQVFTQRETLQLQGRSRGRNGAKQDGLNSGGKQRTGWGLQTGSPWVRSTQHCVWLATGVLKIVEVHENIHASVGRLREASTLGYHATRKQLGGAAAPLDVA